MKKNEFTVLSDNMIVVLNNGMIGLVVSFNNIPSHIVFKSFVNSIDRWDTNGTYKGKDDYSINKILDGKTVLNPQDVFKKSVVNNLPILWEKE